MSDLIITMHEAGNGSKWMIVERCIASIVHAAKCQQADCEAMDCNKKKRIIRHTQLCKKRLDGKCTICKPLIRLCVYHAKRCDIYNCLVPFCTEIRKQIAEQEQVEQVNHQRVQLANKTVDLLIAILQLDFGRQR